MPSPVGSCGGELSLERGRQLDSRNVLGSISSVERAASLDLLLKGVGERVREDGGAVAIAFAFANDDLVSSRADLQDPEPEPPEKPSRPHRLAPPPRPD